MTDEAGLLEIEKDRKTKTAVICPVIKTAAGMMTAEEEAARENEAAGLVLAMGQEVVFCETVRMSAIVPKSFFGKGTLERLKTACVEKAPNCWWWICRYRRCSSVIWKRCLI